MSKNKSMRTSQLNALWLEYTNSQNDRLFRQLVEYYFPYVQEISVKVAEKLGWRYQPEELASFGVDGLYASIPRFNLDRGIQFESFAARRIRGAMIDGLRRDDAIPRSVRIASEQFEKHKQRVQNHVGRRLSDVEFVSTIGMDEDEYHKNHRKFTATNASSLDTHDDDTSEEIKADSNNNLIDSSISMPNAKLCRQEFFSKLMSGCSNRIEQKIVYLYYYRGLTMDKVANAIDLSESRVSQIHKKIINRLKGKVKRNPSYFDQSIIQHILECNHRQGIFG